MFAFTSILIIQVVVLIIPNSFCFKEEKFFAGVLCDLAERLSKSCSTLYSNSTTLKTCTIKCSRDPSCLGISVEKDNRQNCFHHFTCKDIRIGSCSSQEENHKYLSKNCAHDGVWDVKTSSCSCLGGWVGKNCQELPTSCVDLKLHGYSGSTLAYLNIGNTSSELTPNQFKVLCAISSGFAAVKLVQHHGLVDFNRRWDEYRDGFYTGKYNLFTGLNTWHALTSAGFTKLKVSIGITPIQRYYTGFYVRGESRNFSLTYDRTYIAKSRAIDGQYLGQFQFEDFLETFRDVPFSTRDVDNDGVPHLNCARISGAGWWFADSADHCFPETYLFGLAPKKWKGNTAANQRFRLQGVDSSLLQEYKDLFSLTIFLMHE